MSLEWWSCDSGGICLYVARRPENDDLLRSLFKKWSTTGVYFKGSAVTGYHFRLGEGPNALKRLGVADRAKCIN